MEPEYTSFRLKIYTDASKTSLYWIEHFSRIESLNMWLTEETTRPYWNENYVSVIFELDSQGNEIEITE